MVRRPARGFRRGRNPSTCSLLRYGLEAKVESVGGTGVRSA